MSRLGRRALVYVGVVLAVVLAGFLAERILGGESATDEAGDALDTLPYRISTRPAPDDVGFWVWDDSEESRPDETSTQFEGAGKVAVGIEEALCRRGTGKPCEI